MARRPAPLPPLQLEQPETLDLLDRSAVPGHKIENLVDDILVVAQSALGALGLMALYWPVSPWLVLALVGENGSGKTTLVKVLAGLFRPTPGRILYGGRDLGELDPVALRDMQAAVFQEHVRYAFTLGENAGLGRAERAGDRAAVQLAPARGGAATVAESLPREYDTPLTREFAGGTELSGGQWQRVAISRGFMREAPLVVLDEPTAPLDRQAEADVFRRFAAMAAGRTTILVSHRLGSARLCDEVLVPHDGRLVEEGTHGELLRRGGVYQEGAQTPGR